MPVSSLEYSKYPIIKSGLPLENAPKSNSNVFGIEKYHLNKDALRSIVIQWNTEHYFNCTSAISIDYRSINIIGTKQVQII